MLLSYDVVAQERIHQGIVDQIVPSALRHFDLPDVIASLAPRKAGVFNGVNPVGQEVGIARMRQVYGSAAAEVGVRDREEQPFPPILERFLREQGQ
jgi:hypothetical protein